MALLSTMTRSGSNPLLPSDTTVPYCAVEHDLLQKFLIIQFATLCISLQHEQCQLAVQLLALWSDVSLLPCSAFSKFISLHDKLAFQADVTDASFYHLWHT